MARGRLRQRRALGLPALMLLAGLAAGPASAAGVVVVKLDEGRIAKLPERVTTIVVGNPIVADVSLQPGGIMVITGKSYGETNLIALDRTGAVLAEQTIRVEAPKQDLLVVYRGTERESYSCSPNCERRITLGDSAAFFDANLSQAGSRVSAAQSMATPTTPARR